MTDPNQNPQNPKTPGNDEIPLEQRLLMLFDVEGVLIDTHNQEPSPLRNYKIFPDIAGIVLESKKRGIAVCAVSPSETAEKMLKDVDFRYLAHKTQNQYWNLLQDMHSYLDVFDATASGSNAFLQHPRKSAITNFMPYFVAMGAVHESRKMQGRPLASPTFVVFKDSKESIKEFSPYDFVCVGVSRAGPDKMPLTTKQEFIANGAHLAYDEQDLKRIPYDQLLADIARFRK